MSDNVISIGTKRSLAEMQIEEQKAQERHQEYLDESATEHRKSTLKALDDLKDRIMAGEIEGLVIAGRNPENGSFLSLALMNVSVMRVDTYLAYAGVLDSLKLDMVDLASSGPHMNLDGSYFAFGDLMSTDDEDDFEEDE